MHQVNHIASPDEVHKGNDDEPDQERSTTDDEGILEADDVAEAEHGGTCIQLENNLGLVGDDLPPVHHGGGQGLAPGAEGGDDEVIKTADEVITFFFISLLIII